MFKEDKGSDGEVSLVYLPPYPHPIVSNEMLVYVSNKTESEVDVKKTKRMTVVYDASKK